MGSASRVSVGMRKRNAERPLGVAGLEEPVTMDTKTDYYRISVSEVIVFEGLSIKKPRVRLT